MQYKFETNNKAFKDEKGDSAMNSTGNNSSSQNNTAIRLTFSYEGNNVSLISEQNIEKMLPPSTQFDNLQNQAGFWYELTDTRKNVIYRQLIDNPIKEDMEVFSDDPKQSITRQKRTDIRGTFSIVIPNIPEANSFDLFNNPLASEDIRDSQRAQNIFHLDLMQE